VYYETSATCPEGYVVIPGLSTNALLIYCALQISASEDGAGYQGINSSVVYIDIPLLVPFDVNKPAH